MSWKKFISLIPVMLDTHTHIILCSWLFHHHVCKFNIIKNTSATSSFQSSIFRFNLNFFVQTNKSETHKKFATVSDFVNILCLYLSCSFFLPHHIVVLIVMWEHFSFLYLTYPCGTMRNFLWYFSRLFLGNWRNWMLSIVKITNSMSFIQ